MGRKLNNPDHPLQAWLIENQINKYGFAEKLGITRQYLDMIIACKVLPGRDLGFKIELETTGVITPYTLKEAFDGFQNAA